LQNRPLKANLFVLQN